MATPITTHIARECQHEHEQTEVYIGEGNSDDVAGLSGHTKPHSVELKKTCIEGKKKQKNTDKLKKTLSVAQT